MRQNDIAPVTTMADDVSTISSTRSRGLLVYFADTDLSRELQFTWHFSESESTDRPASDTLKPRHENAFPHRSAEKPSSFTATVRDGVVRVGASGGNKAEALSSERVGSPLPIWPGSFFIGARKEQRERRARHEAAPLVLGRP